MSISIAFVYMLKELNGNLAAIPRQAVSIRTDGDQHSKLKKSDLVYRIIENDRRIPLVLVSKCFWIIWNESM